MICGNRDSDDNDDDDVEDEPTLEIDESWYSDDEDDDNPNVSTYLCYTIIVYLNSGT